MATVNQTATLQIFDFVPVAVLNFGVDGKVTYANKAALKHPGKPAESMHNKPVIKSLARDLALGKLKFPFNSDVELAGGLKVKGVFVAGLTGLDIAFVEMGAGAAPPAAPKTSVLGDVIALMRDELGRPLRRMSGALDKLPETPESTEAQEAADALNQRMNRMMDLITVFGDELLVTTDRIDLVALVTSTCAGLETRAKARRVYFVIQPPADALPPIYGNAKIIQRAFTECFENAMQHSRQEVSSNQELAIRIGFTLTGQRVLISVNNLGVMPDESTGIETRDTFLTEKSARPAGRLGLPLVERIVGLHGGNMRMNAVGDDEVRVLLEFPTGAPVRGQAQLDIAQAQRYAADLAELMSRQKRNLS